MHEKPKTSPRTRHTFVVKDTFVPPSQTEVRTGRQKFGWNIVRHYPLPLATLLLLILSLVAWFVGQDALAHWILLLVIIPGLFLLAWHTLQQFLHKEFGVDVIAILAIGGSALLGEYLAGALVVLMLSGGEALEAYAVRRASSSLSALAERAPRTAHVWRGGELISIPADHIDVGMLIIVKPGELVPADGVVTSGSSNMSEADLTGEPIPVRKTTGMLVLSGSVNLDGIVEIRASKRSAESQYAQIVRLVEEAQAQKAPIHRLADRYSVGFTLIALFLAGLAWILSKDPIYALAVMVVATPCPLILATPIAIMSGIDTAARNGIIVKSGASIELLGEVDTAVFDKTGTLTLGSPKVTTMLLAEAMEHGGVLERKELQATDQLCASGTVGTLLCLAGSVEQLSTHILARAILEAAQQCNCQPRTVSDFEEVFGKGVRGCVSILPEDRSSAWLSPGEIVEVAVGNRTFMKQLAIPLPDAFLAERERRRESGQICSFLAVDRQVKSLLVLTDIPRPELAQLASRLREAGIKETLLLTGDSEIVAQQIGKLAQVDRVIARCLPENKVQIVKQLRQEGRHVLMVGDGINDAPALATATVGMALGTQGLTAAAAAADTVLLSTDILRVPRAVRLGRRVMRVAVQGIWVGIGLSVIAMVCAAFGLIAPAAGAVLQEGIDVLVILNALRVGRIAF